MGSSLRLSTNLSPLTGYRGGEKRTPTMEQKQVALRVVVFQEGEWVCGQCLEHDIAARAKTLEDCLHEFERLVVGSYRHRGREWSGFK